MYRSPIFIKNEKLRKRNQKLIELLTWNGTKRAGESG